MPGMDVARHFKFGRQTLKYRWIWNYQSVDKNYPIKRLSKVITF